MWPAGRTLCTTVLKFRSGLARLGGADAVMLQSNCVRRTCSRSLTVLSTLKLVPNAYSVWYMYTRMFGWAPAVTLLTCIDVSDCPLRWAVAVQSHSFVAVNLPVFCSYSDLRWRRVGPEDSTVVPGCRVKGAQIQWKHYFKSFSLICNACHCQTWTQTTDGQSCQSSVILHLKATK